MEELLSGLLSGLIQIVGEVLTELVFELAMESLARLIDSPKLASWLGLAFGGAVAGLLSLWLVPHRLIETRAVLPGISLLLAPLVTGTTMHFLGIRLKRLGRQPTNLITFRGAALFAFSMALVRLVLIGRTR